MTLRKIITDNSVKYIPQREQTRDFEPKTRKNNSLHFIKNKTKSFHKTIKKSLKLFQETDLGFLNQY